MKKNILILCGIVASILIFPTIHNTIVEANTEDEYSDWIVWRGGKGKNPYTICDTNGYFVNGIRNKDHGNNNQSAIMTCNRIDKYVRSNDTDHDHCTEQQVRWFGGKGDKPWSHCPDGKYACGFQIEDYGNNNQAIAGMRCCNIGGITTSHGDSYDTPVPWSGGSGVKSQASCKEGYYVTGIRNKDHGKNNQSVGEIRCTQPEIELNR
jgi:hypothetical protein